MIRNVDISLAPLVAGEMRELRIYGDGPFRVSLKCFVFEPPPPGYRECPECAVRTLAEGEAFLLRVSRRTWADRAGELQLRIVDSTGDHSELAIRVVPSPEDLQRSSPASM